MVTTKRASAEDTDSLLQLSKMLFAEIGHPFPIADSSEAKVFFRNLFKSKDYIAFIASAPENPACAFITLNEGTSVYAGGRFGVIREFYVIEEKRSSGIGKALLQSAIECAQRNGWKRLEVTPPHQEAWKRTYNFYRREGFTEIGPRLKLECLA